MPHVERNIAALAFVCLMTTLLLAGGQMAALPTPAVPAVPGVHPQIGLEEVAGGLDQPVGLAHAGDDRLFVVEQSGRVRVIDGGALQPGAWLDLSGEVSRGFEQGLLSIAFHPDFTDNGDLYVSYTDTAGDSVLSRFSVNDPDTGTPDPSSEEVLLQVDQPFNNHNGGNIKFGPDGYLYYGLGDGGSGGDPQNNAQDTSNLLGAFLRIDVDVGQGYAIPADNPFADGVAGQPEIWSYGVRNPWRWSFDRETGDLWFGDVGQGTIEEVNHEPAGTPGGSNYGWRMWEGSYPHEPLEALESDTDALVFPVIEYVNELFVPPLKCSVTGGYVYRGDEVPDLEGWYLYSDWCAGTIWGHHPEEEFNVVLMESVMLVSSFGEDRHGEVYVLDHGGGTVNKVVAGGVL